MSGRVKNHKYHHRRTVLISAAAVIVLLFIQVFILIKYFDSGKYGTFMVEMSDGVKLATDVYLPDGDGPFPVILYRTPYDKDKDAGPLNLIKYGVAVVAQDSRGCHSSEGEYAAFGTDGQDAYDTVAWMKEQPWFNGKYATYGGSARGITQYMQVTYLDDVAAQYIEVATPDLFSQALFQGGAPRKMLAENWLSGIGHGDYYDTIFYDMSPGGEFADAHSLDYSDYSAVTWPAIHKGGWFDCFGQGTIDGFMGYQYGGGEGGAGNSKLIMGPWVHSLNSVQAGDLVFPENASYAPYSSDIFNAMFAESLLGVTDYGDYRDMPNVIYYVMGDVNQASAEWNQWAVSDVWPVPYSDVSYYLQPDGSMSAAASATEYTFNYAFDPTNPVTTLGGNNLYTTNRGSFDQRAVEDGRTDIITFDMEITEPLLITGRISASLYVTSDCIDTDFTVKLMDVYPDGSAWNIADGIVRMRYRNGMEQAEFLDGTGETVYQAAVDLWSTSYCFNAGHTLRISISSSNYPRFDVNPNTGAAITPATESTPYLIAHNAIIVSPEYPSAIILPIPSSAPEYVLG